MPQLRKWIRYLLIKFYHMKATHTREGGTFPFLFHSFLSPQTHSFPPYKLPRRQSGYQRTQKKHQTPIESIRNSQAFPSSPPQNQFKKSSDIKFSLKKRVSENHKWGLASRHRPQLRSLHVLCCVQVFKSSRSEALDKQAQDHDTETRSKHMKTLSQNDEITIMYFLTYLLHP